MDEIDEFDFDGEEFDDDMSTHQCTECGGSGMSDTLYVCECCDGTGTVSIDQ